MPIPSVNSGETQDEYVSKCAHALAGEYDTNEQLIAVCISSYERGTKMSRTPQQRVEMRINGVNLIFGARAADERLAELAEEGGGSYPFDECVQDQIKRYGSEETAKKVCGAIKRDYGS